MSEPDKKARFIPKGGRKGGAVFPRTALKDAVEYARKLVSKSHTAPISQSVLLTGVLGAKGGIGEVRASAVKQYSLSIGDKKTGFSASDLAKKISVAPPDELPPLLRQAALSPVVFKGIFDTYHGDTVARAKLKQRAADLKVHPDQAETCADLYVKTMEFAGLVTVDGDKVVHLNSSAVSTNSSVGEQQERADVDDSGDSDELDEAGGGEDQESEAESDSGKVDERGSKRRAAAPKAVININVSLDSTTDSDKLAKQLALLRRYGAI